MNKHLRHTLAGLLMVISLLSGKVALAGERGGNGVIKAPSIDLPGLECEKTKIIKSPKAKFNCTDGRGYEFRVDINGIISGMLVPLSGQKFKISCSFFRHHEYSGVHKSVKISSTFKSDKNRCFIKSKGKGKVELEAKSISITEL